MAIAEFAPAKLNLALHVTGRRADGYHLLDMLVVFADIGDRLHFEAAHEDRFTLAGRFGPRLAEAAGSNLVITARDRLRAELVAADQPAPPVSIHLEKNLPLASGIGGGSADAAATLRGLCRLWQAQIPPERLSALALGLGADVPMCLKSQPLIARGIGDDITMLPDRPALHLLIVNPLREVSTPAVFSQLACRNNPPVPANALAANALAEGVAGLSSLRNDLQPPAIALLPVIAETLAEIERTGAMLVRMSGSGATCFGLYPDAVAAHRAGALVRARRPDWFTAPARSYASGERPAPRDPAEETA